MLDNSNTTNRTIAMRLRRLLVLLPGCLIKRNTLDSEMLGIMTVVDFQRQLREF